MWRTLREEEAVPVHLVDGPLLAHYEEGRSRICEEVSQILGASQFDSYPLAKLAKYDYPMALPHVGAQFGGAS